MKILYLLKNKPKFCHNCGKRLNKETTVASYDIHTGKPKRLAVFIACPNAPYDNCDWYAWTEKPKLSLE